MLKVLTSILLLCSPIVHACFRSSLFYRSKIRTRSHVFAPGEYQPRSWEHTTEASGPLDSRDFLHTVKCEQLVRVESPLISFETEEARYMTEGCRDHLIKLAIQVQNTWSGQQMRLHVLRGWIKPPTEYKPPIDQIHNTEGSLVFASEQHQQRQHSDSRDETDWALHSNQPRQNTLENPHATDNNQFTGAHRSHLDPIVDLTSDMMVNEDIYTRRHFNGPKPVFWNRMPSLNPIKTSPMERPGSYWNPWRPSYPRSNHPFLQSVNNFRPAYTALGASSVHTRTSRSKRDLISKNMNSSSPGNVDTPQFSSHRLFSRSLGGLDFYSSRRSTQPVSSLSQSRFHRWLDMRMEEFHYAGRAIDFRLVGTRPTQKRDHNLGVLAQIAYYVAQFDWCYYSYSGHVHCSVKPDSSITSQWFGCFPAAATLRTEKGGTIAMKDLRIGTRVLTQSEQTGELTPTTVVGFMHRDVNAEIPMITVTYRILGNHSDEISQDENLHRLILTPSHLIYTTSEGASKTKFSSIFAGKLRPGTIILTYIVHQKTLGKAVVTNVSLDATHGSGIYAPLTELGTLLVDDVFVSCFAQFTSEPLAWLVTWPIKLFYKLRCLCGHVTWEPSGVNSYLNLIYQVASSILPSSLFY